MYDSSSGHFLDQVVDQFISGSEGTEALDEGVSLDLESTEWRGELEWPQEVVGFLELWSAGNDLVNEVLHAVDARCTESVGDDAIVGERNTLSVDLSESTFVDQLGNGLLGWETVSDVWLNDSNHVPGSLVELNEHSIVQLSESQKLQDLLWLWGKLIDTLDSDNESNLWFALDEEVSILLGFSLTINDS